MTDARLPERWLNDRRMARLSDGDWRAFCNCLMWSVSNRTDGVIHPTDVELIPRFDVQAADRLVSSEILVKLSDGWLINEFVVTQTTAKQLASVERARVVGRDRQQRKREREREAREQGSSDSAGQPVVTRYDTGQDRTGQARTGTTTAPEREFPPGSGQCPGCGHESRVGLVATLIGLRCRHCAAGLKAGSTCAGCDNPRETGPDGLCTACRNSQAGAA